MKVSVIVPNWNGKYLLEDCMSSLSKQEFRDFEIILVDNGSEDGSIEWLESNYPNVKIIEFQKNHGFAKAINEGVKKSSAEYVVLLNNDTKVDKNFLSNLVKFADKHPEVISVNPKILNFFEHKKIDGVGIEINEVGQAKSIGWNEEDLGQYQKQMYIFGATAGASLFRRSEFIKVGLFDESYFMYSEEVDFAFRAQFLGYKSIYCPRALVYHKHKASSRKIPQHVEYWQFRNMTQTIIKDYPFSILVKKWRWLKIILVQINTIFFQIKNGFLWPPFLTILWILLNFPRLLKKRKIIQKSRKVGDDYIEGFLKPKRITFYGLMR